MKFDTLIIGAGLAGLTAAIRLAEKGNKVGLVAAGRSALHFSSGSFGLLGFDSDHRQVDAPLDAWASLHDSHPYNKIGRESFVALADDAASLLRRAGVKADGTALSNHLRISPLGVLRPAWLTLDCLVTLDALKQLPEPHLAIVSFAGFLDFYPRFIAASLEAEGFKCDIVTVDTPDLRRLRSSASEMRAVNIARIMHDQALSHLADSVKSALAGTSASAIILPAVFDYNGESECLRLRQMLDLPVFYAPTMGASVPGVTVHSRLMSHFISIGGRVLNGHRIISAEYSGNKLSAVFSDKLDDDALRADNFIFAGGSFFSRGVVALPDAVVNPSLGLDTYVPDTRFSPDLFLPQAISSAGVVTDSSFHASRGGKSLDNVYAVGSAIAGADSLREDSGAGVALLSALSVADQIIKHA